MKRQITTTVLLSILAASCGFISDNNRELNLGEFSDISEVLQEDNRYMIQRELEVQDWVATCMANAGFEYISWAGDNYSTDYVDISENSETPTIDSLIATQQPQQVIDPNEEILDNLPLAEKSPYFEALWGREDIAEGQSPSGDERRVGCYNAAWVKLYGADAVEARWNLFDLSGEIDARVKSDSAFLSAQRQWSSCMASNGYELETPTGIAQVIVMIAESDTSDNYRDTRSFERDIRSADDDCDDDLDETTSSLRNDFLGNSAQASIDILLADIADRQVDE
ncbi:MAG: hypothetical protein OXB92_01995 [Acidimicrobiaceae bacterium]|nr:hypothetical protein [Acidimicrobiia bacterium]MCY4492614.1 hypothetical protein [Acidimicrobiaceae bacterium]